MPTLLDLRKEYHRNIGCKILGYRADSQVLSNADGASEVSVELARGMADRMAVPLCTNRRGQNYTIPDTAALVPVVVTPRLMYTTDPSCTTRWFSDEWGLNPVSGSGELIAFLNGYISDEEA
jgi:hypothetical protein